MNGGKVAFAWLGPLRIPPEHSLMGPRCLACLQHPTFESAVGHVGRTALRGEAQPSNLWPQQAAPATRHRCGVQSGMPCKRLVQELRLQRPGQVRPLGDKTPKPGVPGRVATKTLQPRQSLRPLLHRVASGRACRPTCLCFFLACHLGLSNGQQRSIMDALREDTHARAHTQFVSTDHVHKARDLFRPARTSLYSDCAAVNDVIMCLAR